MPDRSIPRLAFIGLGNMGLPMVTKLVEAGFMVTAFDLSLEARERAAQAGASVASSAQSAAADADLVILMLPNSAIVTAVVRDLQGSGALSTPKVVIDMSSSDPSVTRTLAAELESSGIGFVDAPVSGGVKGAERGTLTIMTGGTPELLQQVAPVLEPMGKVVNAGPVGAGHAVKALNNLLSATHLWITSEAIEAGQRFGLTPEAMLTVFNGSSGRSGSTENKWPNFILPGSFDSGFALGLMLKDMKIATQLAEQTGSASRLGEAAVKLWEEAAAALSPSADHTEVARWIHDRVTAAHSSLA